MKKAYYTILRNMYFIQYEIHFLWGLISNELLPLFILTILLDLCSRNIFHLKLPLFRVIDIFILAISFEPLEGNQG